MVEAIIFCDCQAALKVLESFGVCSRVVMECLESLNDMYNYFHIRLLWIAGHQGFLRNCKADELDRDGTTTNWLRNVLAYQSLLVGF